MLRRDFLLSITAPLLYLPIYPTELVFDEEENCREVDLGDVQKVDYIFTKKPCDSNVSCFNTTDPENPKDVRYSSLKIRNKRPEFEVPACEKYTNYYDYADSCWRVILAAALDHREIRDCFNLEMIREEFKNRGKKLTDVFLDTYMRFDHEPIPEVQIHRVSLRKHIEYMEDKLGFDGMYKEYDILAGMDLSNKDNFIVPMKDDMYGCAVLDPDCVVLGQVGHS